MPEIADGLIEIGISVSPVAGPRSRCRAWTHVDPVGSCVDMRGSRITKIADELGGEKIDIIPWAEDPAQFIINLKPAGILSVSYDEFRDRAKVTVSQDQLPLAIGKASQNVRLSARLTGYRIDIKSEGRFATTAPRVAISCSCSSTLASSRTSSVRSSSTCISTAWPSSPR